MRDGAPAFLFKQGLDRTRRRQRKSAVPPLPGPDGQMVDGGASKSDWPFLSRAGIDVDTLGEDTELSALTDGPHPNFAEAVYGSDALPGPGRFGRSTVPCMRPVAMVSCREKVQNTETLVGCNSLE